MNGYKQFYTSKFQNSPLEFSRRQTNAVAHTLAKVASY